MRFKLVNIVDKRFESRFILLLIDLSLLFWRFLELFRVIFGFIRLSLLFFGFSG